MSTLEWFNTVSPWWPVIPFAMIFIIVWVVFIRLISINRPPRTRDYAADTRPPVPTMSFAEHPHGHRCPKCGKPTHGSYHPDDPRLPSVSQPCGCRYMAEV